MADNDDLLDRFLNACEDLKDALGRQAGRKFNGIGTAVTAMEDDPVVKANEETLVTLVKLRNTVQHSRRLGGRPIATPRLDVGNGVRKKPSDDSPAVALAG